MDSAPIYVKVDKYKELVEVLHTINEKLAAVDKTIAQIGDIKAQEDAQIQAWHENMQDIRSRVERINRSFYEG